MQSVVPVGLVRRRCCCHLLCLPTYPLAGLALPFSLLLADTSLLRWDAVLSVEVGNKQVIQITMLVIPGVDGGWQQRNVASFDGRFVEALVVGPHDIGAEADSLGGGGCGRSWWRRQ